MHLLMGLLAIALAGCTSAKERADPTAVDSGSEHAAVAVVDSSREAMPSSALNDVQPTLDASPSTSVEAVADAAAQPTLAPAAGAPCKDPTLRMAMNDFVLGLRARDVERLIALFPKDRPLKLASTVTETATFTYEEAAAGMRARDRKDGLYSLLVDASDPTFMQYVLDGVEWTWVGATRFVPDGGDRKTPVYVTWRKEKGRWVIDTIGFPMA
jgi:hypothetical protein